MCVDTSVDMRIDLHARVCIDMCIETQTHLQERDQRLDCADAVEQHLVVWLGCSYGLCSHALYSYGPCSYGLCSYVLCGLIALMR